MPVVNETFDAILFDMDGTLVDSTQGVVGAWKSFKKQYTNLDIEKILISSHGVRTVDNLRIHCGITDPQILETEARRFELEIVNCSGENGRPGIFALPGVPEIVESLLAREDACDKWALCTSATRAYASSAMKQAGIPTPKNFVAAEDVEQGKPAPDPYLKGAQLCNADPRRCLVIEDSPAGIASGRLAGCKTLAVTTSHDRESMIRAKPDFLVLDLSRVKMRIQEHGFEVEMTIVD